MTEWEPATAAEVAMRDALRADDQESYFRILAGLELLLPVSPEAAAGRAPLGWGTWSSGGRTHVLAFTSAAALQACLAEHAGSARTVGYRELAATWPNLEWWLAVNPGLPVEGYLPAWFVAQLARGDLRLPQRGAAAARATAAVPPPQAARAPGVPISPGHGGAVLPQRSAWPDGGAAGDPPDRAAAGDRPGWASGTPAPAIRPAVAPAAAATASGLPVRKPGTVPTDPAPLGVPQPGGPQPAAATRPSPVSSDSQPPYVPAGAQPPPVPSAAQGPLGYPPAGVPPATPVSGAPGPGGPLPRRPIPGPSEQPGSMAAAALARTRAPQPVQQPPVQQPPAVGPTPGDPMWSDRPTSPPAVAGRPSGSFPLVPAPGPGRDMGRSTTQPADAAGAGFEPGPLAAAPDGDPPTSRPPVGDRSSDRPPDAEPPAGEPGPQQPDFEPANEVEYDLLTAAGGGNTDVFLSTLLLATVLVPVVSEARPGSRPGDPDFAWKTEDIDGERFLVVFTSPMRLAEHHAEPVRTRSMKFFQLIRNWPDPTWSFAVNPGTPVGATLPGAQVIALASWAAEAGLSGDDRPDEAAEDQQAAATPSRPAAERQQPTIMQKTVPPNHVEFLLDRGYDRVSGFVHRASEVEHLRSPAALYAALGLGYAGSPFESDAKEAYLLRWPAHRPGLYRIPYGGPNESAMQAMDGWVIERPPFRGNGFAPAEHGEVIAEFKVDSARLPHGAQLWRLDADGAETLIALYDSDAPAWRRVGGDDA